MGSHGPKNMVETAAITTKETDLQRARELAGARRRANGPSSAQEGGFQAPRLSASPRIREMQRQEGMGQRMGARGGASLRRTGGNTRSEESNAAANNYKESLRIRRESSKASGAFTEGKLGKVGDKVQVAKQKIKAGSDIAKDSVTLLKSFTNPISFFSLLSKMNMLKDWTYISALLAATFDDILIDVSQLGDIPVLGGLLSVMCQIFMSCMYLLSSGSEDGDMDRVKRQMLRRMGLMIISVIIEFIPVIAMIPSEMLVGLFIYAYVLAERKRKSDHAKKMAREVA